MAELGETIWGELRSALHAPCDASWSTIAAILVADTPEHKALCDYAVPILERWPDEVVRAVPDEVLSAVLDGAAAPEWVFGACNGFHVCKRRRATSRQSGAVFVESVRGESHLSGLIEDKHKHRTQVARLLDEFVGLQCTSVRVEEVQLQDASDVDAMVRFLTGQRDVSVLSLAHCAVGKKSFSQLWDTGVFAHLERLCLDGNHIGKTGMAQLFSGTTRWSDRPIRELSWELALSNGQLVRLFKTPWFSELEALNIQHNALRPEGVRAWKQLEPSGQLTYLDAQILADAEVLDTFATIECLSSLRSLRIHSLSAWFIARQPEQMRGEVLARFISKSVWRDHIEHLALHWSTQNMDFEPLMREGLPPSLKSFSLNGASRDLEPFFQEIQPDYPDVDFWVGNRLLSQTEAGEWSWDYQGISQSHGRWWREVDDGKG